ncbi:LacI family DNA-binding transcriptional regulator [Methylocapsa sp. S129]|uniref:LacI family DNA-binding transcriptional regulator n=1 Tax=Methylocapsa sp. S129 TaxID=1641869 RepID=UPI00131DAF95|nr:LacI family DNA-binding transcriptional regulator [Methylocapsa sp. S129]
MKVPPASIKDVAKRAGVSAGTVSNVFSGNRPVKPGLAKRVREAAAALGYEPDRAASQLRGGKGRVVGIVIPELSNPFFTSLVAAIETAARAESFDILVASSSDDDSEEAARLRTLLAWKPAGVVIVPASDEFPSRGLLEKAGLPFVVVDRVPQDFTGDAVSSDNFDAGLQAARHLFELGHRDIVVAASSMRLQNIRERCSGIESVLRETDSAPLSLIELGFSFESAAARLEQLATERRRPTAFLALTNFGTLGVLATLQQWNARVPDDVSVLGFDDYSWMRAVSPPLTAIRQPVEEMGRRAWRILRRRIEGDSEPPEGIRLACTLERRRSTATCPPGTTIDIKRPSRRDRDDLAKSN